MQRGRTIDDGDRAFGAGDLLQHALEPIDKGADRGNEGALDALFEVGDLVSGEHRFVQAEDAVRRPHRVPHGIDDRLRLEV